MDARDPLTRLTREVEGRVPFLSGRVNLTPRHLRAKDMEVMTIASLCGACATLLAGIAGVKTGSRPSGIDGERQQAVLDAAVEWWQAVCAAIGPAIGDHEHCIASAPATLAAVGAMGHPILAAETVERRRQVVKAQFEKLAGIDWRRGPHWEGIAGKRTASGPLTVGGPKEASYAIFEALNDDAPCSRSGPASLGVPCR